ncbi:uncharacterized protein yc1106_01375 [Curvularia clavata]|uniref:Hydrolase n=1 Tax=Curvularia clavata TaxID=95742 RepID=A0A9Q8Z1B1_CURCL|nr:uncharacterized protein yc1106_01375 [Curvularia clavata]
MSASKRRNLLLCLDAFDTLFTPSIPIPTAYAQAASRHGINVPSTQSLASSFKSSFKQTAQKYPNYGKQTSGLSPEKWWGAIIESTFSPFLKPGQKVPESLTKELLHHYSSSKGYSLFPDVTPFFDTLRLAKRQSRPDLWPWERTITGIITNSDDRVPGILTSFGFNIASRRYGTKSNIGDASMPKGLGENAHGEDIDFVVLSYDAGFEKPHPSIFAAAEELLSDVLSASDKRRDGDAERELQVSDFEKLYVGDDVEKDYFGAREAGWNALFLQRGQAVESGTGIRRVEVEGKDGEKRKVDSVSSLSDIASWQPV